MKRHAYLIIAHNKFELLGYLVGLLDDIRNDIYIHIDKKVTDFNFEQIRRNIKLSNVYFVPRISVSWGGYSQIQCELILLKEAFKREYTYYHLLSGVDLPLKSQDFIHKYFQDNEGTEFVHYTKVDKKKIRRVSVYHPLQEYRRTPYKVVNFSISLLAKSLEIIQDKLHINRLANTNFEIKYGSNWFSITNNLVKAILDNEIWIDKHFSKSVCADELFLQTFIYYYNLEGRLTTETNESLACLRKIDWNRGNPYTWKAEDFEELSNSDYLFARKFDPEVDYDIILRTVDYVKGLK